MKCLEPQLHPELAFLKILFTTIKVTFTFEMKSLNFVSCLVFVITSVTQNIMYMYDVQYVLEREFFV